MDTGGVPRTWVEISTVPCARDTDGFIECWSSDSWEGMGAYRAPIPPEVPFREFNNIDGGLYGVTTGGAVVAIDYAFGIPQIAANLIDATELNFQCALQGTSIVCWDTSPSKFPPDRDYVFVHGQRFSHAALTTTNELIVVAQTSSAPPLIWQLPETKTYTDLVHFEPSGGCALADDGTIDCRDPTGFSFDNPPYRFVAGGFWSVCAVREDWVVECRYDHEFDFGPIRAIEVTQQVSYERIDVGTPDEQWFPIENIQEDTRPFVCVITTDNAVVCDGFKYDFPDLQEALPPGDGSSPP